MADRIVTVQTAPLGAHAQTIDVAGHQLFADEPLDLGGDDTGPTPIELVLAALGACTSMTMKMYATRKDIPMTGADVRLTGKRTPEGFVVERSICLQGKLTDEQTAKLLEIADKCPVHRVLTGDVKVNTQLVASGPVGCD